MSLKAKVKDYFTRPPCNFRFEADDTKAINNGIAVLQCKDDRTATLAVQMPSDPELANVVTFNTNALVLLCLVGGFKDGDAWLAECFRAPAKRQGTEPFMTIHANVRYELIINRTVHLVTLTATEAL